MGNIKKKLSKYSFLEQDISDEVTIEKIIESIIAYYEGVISCMPGNVYWLDNHGRTVGCNKNVLDMFGFHSIDQFKNLSFEQMGEIAGWSPEVTASFKRDTFEVLRTGKGKLNIEEPPIRHHDGRIFHFLTHRVPLIAKGGKIIGVVGISIDISDRKRMESELLKAKEEAESANKAKTEFLENMRHDIRTPLTGITGFASIIAEESREPRIKEYAENLIASSYALVDLLNEILEVIRIGSHEIPILKKKFNIKNKLYEVIKLTKARALQKNLLLTLEYDDNIPSFVMGDPTRIHRLVLELVTNALNFTNQGFVKVSAHLEKETEREIFLKLEVEDSGVGIPPEKKQEIFHRFKRLTPSFQGIYKGAGLGLAIVKQFIDDLDGEIYTESREGGGTRFIVILSLTKSLIQSELGTDKADILPDIKGRSDRIISEPEAVAYDEPTETRGKIRILLVEDHEIAAIIAIKMLSNLDCQVTHAANGEQAIKFFRENHYQLVFMDIGLPDLDGYEVTRRMRLFEFNKDRHVPIIALTAHVDERNKQQCIAAGMNAVFSKPITKAKAEDILNAFIPYREQVVSSGKTKEIVPPGQIINIGKLNELYSGNQATIKEILKEAIKNYPVELNELKEAHAANQDWETLKFIAHKLKGGAIYCAADHLVDKCSQLEAATKNKQEETIATSYSNLVKALENFLIEAEKIVSGK